MTTTAERAVEEFNRRAARGGTAKFMGAKIKGVKIETSSDAPGATFYRFPDESMVRVDRRDGETIDIQPC